MIIHDVIQGTSEWKRARAGIPTASGFSKIVTSGGANSKSREKYLHHLIAERLIGEPIDEISSSWMKRGQAVEPEALAYYEGQRNVDTEAVGFITNDEGTIGASPDRLVGEDGLVELKAPAPHTHVHYLLGGLIDSKYKPQAQGQLWITGRKWVDLCSYHPEMPKVIVRVERDDAFIETLAREVTAFSAKLEAIVRDCGERGWLPDTRRDDMLEQLSRSLRNTKPQHDPDELVFE